jgi:hypothetical protein
VTNISGGKDLKLTAYPNPSKGNVCIRIPQELSQSAILRIYNIYGQEIGVIETPDREVVIENLNEGVYHCTLEQQGSIVNTVKLIVVK